MSWSEASPPPLGFTDLLDAWPRTGEGRIDLGRAPLRLIAISNRMDLGDDSDALSPAGEGRFVFALTRGPGDERSSELVPATIILEYSLPPTRSVGQWAATWHALGEVDDRDAYRAALERLTRSFTNRGAFPGRTEASALAQVRASVRGEDGHVALHELAFDEGGDLSSRGLRNTPSTDLEGDAALATWMHEHEREIREGRHVLPARFRTSAVSTSRSIFTVAGIDEDVLRGFDQATCNGCHREARGGIDGGFHVSPLRHGRARLSPFLHDAVHRDDDLARREDDLHRRLGRR